MATLGKGAIFTAWRSRSWKRFRQDLMILGLVLGVLGCSSEPNSLAAVFVRWAPGLVVDAFMTQDQQGRAWYEAGEWARAAQHFRDPLWKGIALEEAGDLAAAALAYSRLGTAQGAFRQANALARLEALPAAVAAYHRALALDPDFSEAIFNLDWVRGLMEIDAKTYEDFGGTGGQLEADEIVFDDRAADALGEMTLDEARAQGLSEEQMREMWMRRVQTTPGEFLRLKFSYQAQRGAP